MSSIRVLDQATINQIAAGEVIERPSSVVKECVENALDAGATAVTVEIRDGGLSFIRITDNGAGIDAAEVKLAFLPHATSKIRRAEDLLSVSSLGFRGEALASIAAVARVELITKMRESLTGIRYRIEGGQEQEFAEIGAPDGTTFVVRELFYNTPARRKFLKSASTEGSYISTLIERLALSRPDVSFRLIVGGQTRLHTAGNHKLKDIIYTIYGREIASCLLPLPEQEGTVRISGYTGKPEINRGNRTYENYFVNGRYVKSSLITKAIENAYRGYVMQQKYPFAVFHLEVPAELIDVNVHPTKMELRFGDEEAVYQAVYGSIRDALSGKELIPRHAFDERMAPPGKGTEPVRGPEPFETERRKEQGQPEGFEAGRQPERGLSEGFEAGRRTGWEQPRYGYQTRPSAEMNLREKPAYEPSTIERLQQAQKNALAGNRQFRDAHGSGRTEGAAALSALEAVLEPARRPENGGLPDEEIEKKAYEPGMPELRDGSETATPAAAGETQPAESTPSAESTQPAEMTPPAEEGQTADNTAVRESEKPRQMELFEDRLLTAESRAQYRLIGQIFDTYWLIQYRDQLLIMDQHAAHEKVLYERNVKALREKTIASQQVQPPLILTLNAREAQVITEQAEILERFGFQVEPFGGREYAVYAVPANLPGIARADLLMELIDSMADETAHTETSLIHDKLAMMSCKAAVKGNHRLSEQEAEALLDELLNLENPYLCPHGRPTIITFSQYELEKKFHRVVD